ncbi:hypothetical protein [Janthinobacterium svalbardensis]|uniref:hypothetical protein n=1 Tax=Janthinobacterium svalbardensis TaxID=368607 RepID=UPI002FCD7920
MDRWKAQHVWVDSACRNIFIKIFNYFKKIAVNCGFIFFEELSMLEIKEAGPRGKKNADKVGAYLLASRINSTVVDPGGFFEFEQYITGYGEISSAKLQCYISGDIFEKGDNSFLKNGMGYDGKNIWFGEEIYKFEAEGFACHIAGVVHEKWTESTPFVDSEVDGTAGIMTERKYGDAPFHYRLKIKKSVKPGDYRVDVYFTYFNGEKWQCNKETVSFKIRSFFERWSTGLSILGILATGTAIIRFFANLNGYKF